MRANRRLAQAGGDRTVYLDDQPEPKPDFLSIRRPACRKSGRPGVCL